MERNFNGPARVSGSAGTGKSVVAMHRAAYLARLSAGGRLLLTTFSKTLASRLSDGMDKLLGAASEGRRRVGYSTILMGGVRDPYIAGPAPKDEN